jgi:hypothetical protein
VLPCRAMSILRTLVIAVALTAPVAPQQDPTGVVLDEELRPIAGASVALRLEVGGGAPFARSRAARVARSPLPAVQSGRDGSYVLPLTEEQRLSTAVWHIDSGCWLVVEKAGYQPWLEPIPAGLATYRGSRVLLRRTRADDPFASVPWPPAVISMRTERGYLPWLPLTGWQPVFVAPGEPAVAPPPDDLPPLATLRVEVVGGGKPVPDSLLTFDDGAWARQADAPALPERTGGDGVATAMLPAGTRTLRVEARGWLPVQQTVELAGGARETLCVELTPAVAVDVLAVGSDGTPVPFVRIGVIPMKPDAVRASTALFTDASGRVRVFVDAPEHWFVYGDGEGAGGVTRTTLDSARDANGFVRVVQHRPVTVLLRGDEWPRHGELRWAAGSRATMRAFQFDPADATAVAFRMCYREHDDVHVGGDRGVPFRIRREDLPPAPAEPLLDLVEIHRTVRQRAVLRLASDDEFLAAVAVRPAWQDVVRHDWDALQQARRVGGRWLLFARDDGPLDLIAVATGLRAAPFTVPARAGGADLPEIEVRLTER